MSSISQIMIEHEHIYPSMYKAYLCDIWLLSYDHVNTGPRQEIFIVSGSGGTSILSPSSPATNTRMGGFSESSAWALKSWSHLFHEPEEDVRTCIPRDYSSQSWHFSQIWLSVGESPITSNAGPVARGMSVLFVVLSAPRVRWTRTRSDNDQAVVPIRSTRWQCEKTKMAASLERAVLQMSRWFL